MKHKLKSTLKIKVEIKKYHNLRYVDYTTLWQEVKRNSRAS